MNTLGQEVARAIQFFFSSTQFNKVDYIILSGGCAAIPGLDGAVAKRTQVETSIANPFSSMEMSSRIRENSLKQDAPSLMVACGLAMRRFDQ
jgi:type IV pilus assembly protein PilM